MFDYSRTLYDVAEFLMIQVRFSRWVPSPNRMFNGGPVPVIVAYESEINRMKQEMTVARVKSIVCFIGAVRKW